MYKIPIASREATETFGGSGHPLAEKDRSAAKRTGVESTGADPRIMALPGPQRVDA